MNNLSLPIIVFVVGLVVALVIYFFIKQNQNTKSVGMDLEQTTGDLVPGFKFTQLSVWTGIKFGFGFTIGAFVATMVIYIVFISLLGLTLKELSQLN